MEREAPVEEAVGPVEVVRGPVDYDRRRGAVGRGREVDVVCEVAAHRGQDEDGDGQNK